MDTSEPLCRSVNSDGGIREIASVSLIDSDISAVLYGGAWRDVVVGDKNIIVNTVEKHIYIYIHFAVVF